MTMSNLEALIQAAQYLEENGRKLTFFIVFVQCVVNILCCVCTMCATCAFAHTLMITASLKSQRIVLHKLHGARVLCIVILS